MLQQKAMDEMLFGSPKGVDDAVDGEFQLQHHRIPLDSCQ